MPQIGLLCLCLPGCFEATNPCDPDASEELRGEGTRIHGKVVDQEGRGIAGVTVTISGRTETHVSGENGVFEFAGLPPSASYELVASPPAPLLGGRLSTAALVCRGALEGVELGVVAPPESPDVELVRASGEARMFAAFGAASSVDPGDPIAFFEDTAQNSYRPVADVVDECRTKATAAAVVYRAQVRAPFGAWQDAVLAPFPWINPPREQDVPDSAAGDDNTLYLARIEDVCAAALCAKFKYIEPELANPNARCVDVVGSVDANGEISPLEQFGSYQVRVLTELKPPDEFRARFALPERVVAEAPPVAGQTTLLPGALLPVMGADGTERGAGNIEALVTTAGARFTLLEDEGLVVMGDGADTLDTASQAQVGANESSPQGAFGEDANAAASMMSDLQRENDVPVKPLALLPAGAWVRTIRRTDDGSASIAKVFVGIDAASAAAGPSSEELIANEEEPLLRVDPTAETADGAVRAFAYLDSDGERLVDPTAAPLDAYVLLSGSSFVLVEQGIPSEMNLRYFATDIAVDLNGSMLDSRWADSAAGAQSAAFGGACSAITAGVQGASSVVSVGLQRKNVSVCYDVGVALEQTVDLRDVEFLRSANAYAFTDAANDRVLVAPKSALTCAGCTRGSEVPLATQLASTLVGREPLGMAQTWVLDCSGGGADRPVLLVANHGSGDLSVLEGEVGAVRETSVVPLPALPTGFLDDPDGPSCEDPFVWVLADDGRVIPVDMRGAPSVPLCNSAACDVGTRGRGAVGAVARTFGLGPSRSLVGGRGLLGELGFFRPKALLGAAYQSPESMASTSAPAPAP